MSDTKLQIKNNKNQCHVLFLRQLYFQRKQLMNQLEYVENKINQKDVEYRYKKDVQFLVKLLKSKLKGNHKLIIETRFKLVIS